MLHKVFHRQSEFTCHANVICRAIKSRVSLSCHEYTADLIRLERTQTRKVSDLKVFRVIQRKIDAAVNVHAKNKKKISPPYKKEVN